MHRRLSTVACLFESSFLLQLRLLALHVVLGLARLAGLGNPDSLRLERDASYRVEPRTTEGRPPGNSRLKAYEILPRRAQLASALPRRPTAPETLLYSTRSIEYAENAIESLL